MRPGKVETLEEDKNMVTRTWADTKMEELEQKNKLDWTADDWDSYCYIMNFSAETDGYEPEE